jgi:hypothetical protein
MKREMTTNSKRGRLEIGAIGMLGRWFTYLLVLVACFSVGIQLAIAGWSTWNSLGKPTTADVTFTPSATAPRDHLGSIHVFVKGSDAKLYYKRWISWRGGWGNWHNLGGASTDSPGCVSRGMIIATGLYEQPIDCFIQANKIVLTIYSRDQGDKWSNWGSLGRPSKYIDVDSSPTVASWDKYRLDIFVKGSDDNMWTRFWNGNNWSNWQNHGKPNQTPLASAPSCVSWSTGTHSDKRIDCFVKAGNALWTKYFNGSHWSKWERHGNPIGTAIDSAPSATSTGWRKLDVFTKCTDGNMWRKSFTWAGGWAWENLGPIDSAPGCAGRVNGNIDCFTKGNVNDDLLTKWYR